MADSQRKTANLFDKNATDESKGYISQNRYLRSNGNTQTPTGETVWHVSEYIDVHLYGYVTFSGLSGGSSSPSMCFYDSSYDYISGINYNSRTEVTAEVPSTAYYIRVSFTENRDYMLNTGSTALPYEPYWQHSLRKLATSTDTLTTLPSTIIADGNSATVGLQGNMTQTGTPTQENPITPQETGERTGNILNADNYYGAYKQSDGTYQTTRANLYNVQIKPFTADDIGKTFTFAADISPITGNARLCAYINGTIVSGSNTEKSVVTFTVETADDSIFFNYGSGSTTVTTLSDIMLVEGSTAPTSYIPYGYKIPISSGGTTTPVYLGEVQSTRQIRKYEFTGEENWNFAGEGTQYAKATLPLSSEGSAISSHFVYGSANTAGQFDFYGVNIRFNAYGVADSVTEWKSYLAQQYAAGTPVCVWYVLATPTTGIVNEPLRKIGDYADSIAGVTIPTITGKDTFDVQTTLKPSEVSLSYTGWHDAEVKEWDGSQWQ